MESGNCTIALLLRWMVIRVPFVAAKAENVDV